MPNPKEVEFMADEEVRHIQKLDYTQLLMNQMDKVRLSGSVEFMGGFWEIRTKVVAGSTIQEKFYVNDTRQVYIGAINQLFLLLLPNFDTEFDEKEVEIEKQIEEHNENKEKEKKNKKENEFNVWYYSELLKIKEKQYKNLIYLMSRMGLFGIKKSKEVY